MRKNNSFSSRIVIGNTLPFISSSDVDSSSLGIDYLLSRSQRSKLVGNFNLRYDDRKSFINNTLVEVSSRRIAAVDLGVSYTRFFPTGTLVLSPTIKTGVGWFGGKDDPADIQDDEPHAEYQTANIFTLYHHYLIPNPRRPVSFQTAFTGQYSEVALNGENQIVIGGEYSVRGFKENVLSGDSGWTWRNDFYLPLGAWLYDLHPQRLLKPIRLKLFLDYGRAISNSDRTQHELAGYGAGLEYRYRWLQANYTYAKAQKNSYPFISPEEHVKYYGLSLNIVF